MTEKIEKFLLRPKEVAEATGLGRSTVYSLIQAGEIPSVRVGVSHRAVRVPVDALREWIARGLAERASERSDCAKQE
jgi:excisionase family DNA binding protein